MPSQKPLTPTQITILSHAAKRRDRAVLPLMLDTKLTGGACTKVLTALLARGLVEEVAADLARLHGARASPVSMSPCA
jgi:DNA-binding MarR family transcriptional regulator